MHELIKISEDSPPSKIELPVTHWELGNKVIRVVDPVTYENVPSADWELTEGEHWERLNPEQRTCLSQNVERFRRWLEMSLKTFQNNILVAHRHLLPKSQQELKETLMNDPWLFTDTPEEVMEKARERIPRVAEMIREQSFESGDEGTLNAFKETLRQFTMDSLQEWENQMENYKEEMQKIHQKELKGFIGDCRKSIARALEEFDEDKNSGEEIMSDEVEERHLAGQKAIRNFMEASEKAIESMEERLYAVLRNVTDRLVDRVQEECRQEYRELIDLFTEALKKHIRTSTDQYVRASAKGFEWAIHKATDLPAHLQARENKIREAANQANEFKAFLGNKYYREHKDVIEFKDAIKSRHDIHELLIFAMDAVDHQKEERYEALEKFFLIRYFMQIRGLLEELKEDQVALKELVDLFDEELIEYPEGEKRGYRIPAYQVATLDENGNVVDAYLTPDRPAEVTDLMIVEPLLLRRSPFPATDGKGNPDPILYNGDVRHKSLFGQFMKKKRARRDMESEDTDRNGIRLCFETKEKWAFTFKKIKERFIDRLKEKIDRKIDLWEEKKQVAENHLAVNPNHTRYRREVKKYEAMIADLKEEKDQVRIEIEEFQDNWDGNSEIKTKSKGSAKKISMITFRMVVFTGKKKNWRYELQVMSPKGLVEYKRGKDLSWDKYDVRRVFDGDVDKDLIVHEVVFKEPVVQPDGTKSFEVISHEKYEKIRKKMRTDSMARAEQIAQPQERNLLA